MWIVSLSLRNFRGFRELELDLRRQLTVLIGVNGSGKSTVVHALRAASVLGPTTSLTPNLGAADLLLGETDLELTVAAAGWTHWVRYEKHAGLAGTFERSGSDESVGGWRPFVLCLDAGRSRLLDPGMSPNLGVAPRPALGMSRFEYAESWFRLREDLENEMRVETRQLDFEDPPLRFARWALKALLPTFERPRIKREGSPGKSVLVFDKGSQVFSADMLSDGEKSLLVMAIDVCSTIANARGGDLPLVECRATIVIDEVELHLHPTWQRVVVPRLLEAFPNCQFVITTHSPQVIGSVDVESLFILEDFAVRPALHPTRGRDSNAILEEIMGATSRDPETETELDHAARLVEVGSEDDAKEAVENLAERFGDDDREVVRLRTALLLRGA